ncbi:hypothetical protein EDEG_00879 [Edhazardia aedis USNM 41457]|uniref:Uncharacterized protein n=1 Tax=Edhazardia aedis (strain USNM 41457) TaxID=1003232 RepID=J9DB97_EDHAE|nr:hypothetical protein EDEG_00879 [Edhazardia aedis USNM 41457]|eukprot:EJW05026.1 hypothetical protein EDEG_00879 [Edhazardia aedis USNM 41457]
MYFIFMIFNWCEFYCDLHLKLLEELLNFLPFDMVDKQIIMMAVLLSASLFYSKYLNYGMFLYIAFLILTFIVFIVVISVYDALKMNNCEAENLKYQKIIQEAKNSEW